MKNLNYLNKFRIPRDGNFGDEHNGGFCVLVDEVPLFVIASNEGDWDHVSASAENRTPTWHEMQSIKDLFFYDHETVVQYHVPKTKHINIHPFCLHLWRSQKQSIILPPPFMV